MTYQKSDPKTIQSMFNNIARRYDFTNAVLSFRMHKSWNQRLVNEVIKPDTSHTLIDLCAGTGDIAFEYLKVASNPCHAHLIDFSSDMLACAKEKSKKNTMQRHTINYIEADVQTIPLPSAIADAATMAYGIRNVKNPKVCIEEAYRLLKPGARFGILELTQPKNAIMKKGHHLYLKYLLPILGKWLTSDQEAYRYLCNSIHTFIAPEEIEKILKASGFVKTRCIPLSGGIATLIVGQKK